MDREAIKRVKRKLKERAHIVREAVKTGVVV